VTVVALDAMGGDDAPRSTTEGAATVAAEGVEVLLVGDERELDLELARLDGVPAALRVVHAADAIGMEDHAALEVRKRRESSIYVAMEQLKQGEADAILSMGNTGAALATALVVLGRIPGVERPALAALLPTPSGSILLLDAGANAEARPSHLVQFARLGEAYQRAVLDVPAPRVGLLSIGEEATKGDSLVQEVHSILQDADFDFIGNVEGGDIVRHTADVVVTDGFTGNVALKLVESLVAELFGELRRLAGSSLRNRAGGALLLPALRGLAEQLDYRRYGAVPLLGVDGVVFVGHGRSDADTIASALRTAAAAVDHGMLDALKAATTDGSQARDAG
jgi:glycerol-3-phosphate acyltransferase PlsX